MKEQAASYLHHSSEYTVASAGGVLKWWANFGHNIPAWQDAAFCLFSLALSSAAVERVFSQLNCMFADSQEHVKSDLIEAALMLRCNQRILSEQRVYFATLRILGLISSFFKTTNTLTNTVLFLFGSNEYSNE